MSWYQILSLVLGEGLVVVMALIIAGLAFTKNRRLAIKTVIAVWLAWVIIEGLKMIFPSPRPFTFLGMDPLVWVSPLASFPSGHAGIAFAMAVSVWLAKHRIGLLMLVLAVGVAIGRVLLYVHFPLDVIVGALIGSGVVLLINRVNLFGLGND